jgi:hypothetical protein
MGVLATRPVILNRGAERAAIDRVLDAVRSGLSGTLVLRGGPGVGKSTLLQYAVEAAPDLRVCGIAGVESEISMEFAGLHQLLVPCLPQLDDLPAPQRGALRVAFGQEAGPRLKHSRCCASSMTRTGSIPNRRRCSASWPAACTPTASALSPASANLPHSRCSSSFRR